MRIRYEEIASGYEEGLRTQLRRFRPAHEFLETWVHDTDPAKSILSMVEAAQMGGIDRLEVLIGESTAKGIDLAQLKALTDKVGRAEIAREGTDVVLQVTL